MALSGTPLALAGVLRWKSGWIRTGALGCSADFAADGVGSVEPGSGVRPALRTGSVPDALVVAGAVSMAAAREGAASVPDASMAGQARAPSGATALSPLGLPSLPQSDCTAVLGRGRRDLSSLTPQHVLHASCFLALFVARLPARLLSLRRRPRPRLRRLRRQLGPRPGPSSSSAPPLLFLHLHACLFLFLSSSSGTPPSSASRRVLRPSTYIHLLVFVFVIVRVRSKFLFGAKTISRQKTLPNHACAVH